MSITSRISSMEEHVTNAYNGLQGLGADLTGIDKNIDNIADVLDDIYDDLPKVTDEDTSITLDNTRVGKLETTLKGNTSQTGTPTPTSPIPVNVVSGNNKIVVYSKNIFTNANKETSTGTIYNNGFILTKSDNRTARFKLPCTFPAGDYKLHFDLTSTNYTGENNFFYVSLQEGENNTNVLSNVTINKNTSITLSAPSEFDKIFFFIGSASGIPDTTTITIDNVMLESGLTDSPFEKYVGNTYNIDLPESMELCKIGTYQDYIYKDSDKWYLHKEIKKLVLNGSESWSKSGTTSIDRFFFNIDLPGKTENISKNTLICSHFNIINSSASEVGTMFVGSSNNLSAIFVNYTSYGTTTLAQWKTWLGTSQPVVYHVLATSTNTEITYQPLIDQLNLLEKAMSKEGQTNISQANNDLPFIISASALKEWSV